MEEVFNEIPKTHQSVSNSSQHLPINLSNLKNELSVYSVRTALLGFLWVGIFLLKCYRENDGVFGYRFDVL